MWPFKRKFRGMIRPNMAATMDEALKVCARQSEWMVQYLRARRSLSEYGQPDKLLAYHMRWKRKSRQTHLAIKRKEPTP